ncbi:FecR family protein [Solitalea canadensis]|uniref:Fe2+-dicitrate sensor, membrane component n=1 Tax=Solitalea canadensis (strain ATCC 29591 / DSM 3403 / JCM 21819 / LMG 8368 / NBRC 15130 / NCIMB 12057 / USAM 9D) TaxID=929556 RepID=H8KXC2_SOLCM|nr:FecR family protein [Solitalea canadensis]AFD08451.1 Fe2+-dicitrate sensor, membrane component [Solitalea canadensis DSM 3403]
MSIKKDLYNEFQVPEYPLSFESEVEKAQIKEEIHQRLQQSIASQQLQKRGIVKSLLNYKVAAALIAVTSFLFISYNYYFKEDKRAYITLSAPKGKVMEFLLPDSSRIVLNAASTLKYLVKFKNTRDVYLEGEAFFDVSHDASKPFIVHTGSVSTRVLGTAFNIKAYKKLPSITVTVQQGKVRVDEKNNNLGLLTPNKQLIVNKANYTAINRTVVAEDATSWTGGKFVLQGVYFHEMMLAIENRFNVKMIYDAKAFSNCQNSIQFTQKQSLTDVLKLLKDIQGIKYTIKNDSVLITGKPCR